MAQFANQVGKSSAAATSASNLEPARPIVGKQTLTESLPMTSEGISALVKPHAGVTVADGSGYTFRALDDGTFEITATPKGRESGLRHVISPRTNPQAWFLVARKLLSEVPPKPAQPVTPTAPAPAAVPAPPPPEPNLLDRAMRTVDAGFQELREGASSLWDRATSWIPTTGGDEAGAPPDTAPSNPTTAPAPSTTAPSTPTTTPKAPASERPAGETSDTLSLAMSRVGVGKTEYTLNGLPHDDAVRIPARIRELAALLAKHDNALKKKAKDKSVAVEGELSAEELTKLKAEKAELEATAKAAARALADELATGGDGVTRFYCSGLSMWTLAAVGYDIDKRLNGPDGTEYRGLIKSKEEKPVDATGRAVKKGGKAVGNARAIVDTKYVTLRLLVDGNPHAIEIVTRAKAEGTSTVEITGTGYQTEHDGEGLAQAARGAAGAFVVAGIGSEVDELHQKPGDFAQSRRTTKGKDSELKHSGAGHAWQVAEVKAVGSALFGKPGSPEPQNKLDGWHANVPFIIKPTTDPRLIGEHTVTAAKRVEAQNETVVADKAGDTGGDGGVQVTGWKAAPDPGLKQYTGYVVFYGRLGTSRWNGWTAATKDSAATAAATTPAIADADTNDSMPASTPGSTTPAAPPPGDNMLPSEPLPPGTPAGELAGGDERLA